VDAFVICPFYRLAFCHVCFPSSIANEVGRENYYHFLQPREICPTYQAQRERRCYLVLGFLPYTLVTMIPFDSGHIINPLLHQVEYR
jgi:hypothetical protein